MLKVSKNIVHTYLLLVASLLQPALAFPAHWECRFLHWCALGSAGPALGLQPGCIYVHFLCHFFFSAFLSPRPGECNGPTVAACASAGAPTGGPLQRCTRLVRAPRLRRPFFRPCAQGFDDFFIVLPLTLTGARHRRAAAVKGLVGAV